MTDESRQQSTNVNVDEQVDEMDDQMRQMELNPPPPPPQSTIVRYNGGPIPQFVYDQYGRQYTTSIIPPTTPIMMQSPASPNTPPPIIIWTSTPPSTPFALVNPFAMPTTPISMNTFAPPSPMSSPGMIISHGGPPPPQQQISDGSDLRNLPMIMAPPPPTTVAMEQQQIQCEMGRPNEGSEYEPPATSTPISTPAPAQYEPPTPIPPAPYTPGAMVYEGGPPPPPPQYYSTNQQYYHESPFVMPPLPLAPPPTAIVMNQTQFGFVADHSNNVQYGPPAISTPTPTPSSIPQLVPMQRYPTPPPFTVVMGHTAFLFPPPLSLMMAQPSGGTVGMARSPLYYDRSMMPITMADRDWYETDRQGRRRQWIEGRRAPKRGNDGCSFCKRNGESREYFSSHQLRDPNGRVECPILRAFECPYCGATGDDSHTASYCPNPPPDVESSSRTATGRIRNSKKK